MIVAECGLNYCGSMEIAKRLIREAKEGGASLAKFQLYDAEDDKDKANYKDVKSCELSYDQAKELFEYGGEVGIEVFFSVFGVKFVHWCEKIGVKRYKLAAPRFKGKAKTHWAINMTGKPLIMSFNNLIVPWKTQEETEFFLYCPVDYPSKPQNIGFIDFKLWDGLSDHSIGTDIAKIALARGAKIIEKHFSIYHYWGLDGTWSMDANQLRDLVLFDKKCQEVL